MYWLLHYGKRLLKLKYKQWKEKCLPDGIGGGWGVSKVLALIRVGGITSFILYNFDSLEKVLWSDEPRDVFGDSVFNILEL